MIQGEKWEKSVKAQAAISKAKDPANQTRTACKRWSGLKMAVNVFGLKIEDSGEVWRHENTHKERNIRSRSERVTTEGKRAVQTCK